MSNKTSVSTRYTGSWFTKECLKWNEGAAIEEVIWLMREGGDEKCTCTEL